MTILASDIKLVTSKVMDDVSNGGGAPTSTEVLDGASNQIFPDISELDRAGGVVNLRKVFVSVQTSSTDTLLGSNVIVAKPPADPNVSISLFTTGDTFDERVDAESRLEAYLAAGAMYNGYLFGNHISGQRTLSMFQPLGSTLPVTDETLLLSFNEASGSPAQQYIRVTSVASEKRTFYDPSTSPPSPFDVLVVTLGLTDALQQDFTGFDVTRVWPQVSALRTGTMIRETVVADAARYYGVTPLTHAVAIGDFSAQAKSIYTSIVPSAQTETALADVRMNQQSAAVVASSSGNVTRNFGSFAWTTTSAFFIGSGVFPGSLTLNPTGQSAITDNGGKLMQNGSQIGTIDYGNGVLSLSTSIFGASTPAIAAAWRPASPQTIVTNSLSIAVTAESQRLTYVQTLATTPAPGTLQVSFRAQGKWYVLTDDGSGALRGSDSSFGVGVLNTSTNTANLTLGALPDVGSEVIFEFAAKVQSISSDAVPVNTGSAETFSKLRKVILLERAIQPGTLTLSWNDGSARTANDNGSGVLTGYATGTVNYTTGNIQFAPTALPPVNTAVTVTISDTAQTTKSLLTLTTGAANPTGITAASPPTAGANNGLSGSVGGAVRAGTFEMSLAVQYPIRSVKHHYSTWIGISESALIQDEITPTLIRVFDGQDGKLYVQLPTSYQSIGTIDYSTGNFVILASWNNFACQQQTWDDSHGMTFTGAQVRNGIGLTVIVPGSPIAVPAGMTWPTAAQSAQALIRYGDSSSSSTPYSGSVTLDTLALPQPISIVTNVDGTSFGSGFITNFSLGGAFYSVQNGSVFSNPSPVSGASNTAVGSMGTTHLADGSTASCVILTTWPTGASPAATLIGGGTTASLSGAGTTSLMSSAVFRTAVAPIKNGSFSVVATALDGTTINATADSSGYFASGTAASGENLGTLGAYGVIDYTYGVVKLTFGYRAPDNATGGDGIVDLSSLGIPGVKNVLLASIQADTLRYNASAYTYLPLDASLIGVNPVRLPSDGRVPIFRAGSYAVIGQDFSSSHTVANGDTISTGQIRLSRVTITGSDGADIETGFTADLEAGTVSFTNVTGYAQPVTIDARIEDMMLVSDAQISGLLTFTRPVTHAYTTDAYVSSALVPGNLKARVSVTFDQGTWDGITFSDTLSGAAATATYDDTNHPIQVTNIGATTERFALQFTSSTGFRVVGEHLGVIASGNTSVDCAPLNSATGQPYFTISAAGWGTGWAVGNVLRINTVGALSPVWVIRTVQQGPETALNDSTTLLIRGDVDRP